MNNLLSFCNMSPGDARICAAASHLARQGCRLLPPEQYDKADFLLTGQPFTDWQGAFAAPPRPGTLIFAGRVSTAARAAAAGCDCPVVDYMQKETLLWQNSVLTAEGALGLLLAAKATSLWGAKLVLTGYGRVARCLAHRLAGLGVQLTVAVRRGEVCAETKADGFAAAALGDLAGVVQDADYLVNTVPAPVLTKQVLLSLPTGAYILDLASAPGGAALPGQEFSALCARRGIVYITAPGLPGRVAPASAGRFIGEAVWQFLVQQQAADASKMPPLPAGQTEAQGG